MPVVVSAVFTPAIAAAATLAFSRAEVNFTGFNVAPESQDGSTVNEATTEASAGLVTVESNSNAFFFNDPPSGGNFAATEAVGSGSIYQGTGLSQSQIIGRFLLPQTDSNPTFQFQFGAALSVQSTIDQPVLETSAATGEILFSIFAGTTPDQLTLVDFFKLTAGVNSATQDDFLKVSSGSNIVFSKTTFEQSFGGLQESAIAVIDGTYSRNFEAGTYITLVETKTNQVNVTAVPTPSTVLATILSGVGLLVKRRKRPPTA
jgi:hypothetical protein